MSRAELKIYFEELEKKRDALKRIAIPKQTELINGRYIAVCGFCRLKPGIDLHEIFLKRGDIPGPKLQKRHGDLIWREENTVLVCRECHDRYGNTKDGEKILHDYKIQQGYDVDGYIKECRSRISSFRSQFGEPQWKTKKS